jgi:hypothetical protein
MSEQHTQESVFKTFQHIDAGYYTNARFSGTNVVMVSKEHYDLLVEAFEHMKELDLKNEC